jgi:hypothetical protein
VYIDYRIQQLNQIFTILEEGKHNFFMGDMNFGDKMVNKEHGSIPKTYTDSWIELSGREPKLKMEYKEGWTIAG